MPLSVTSSAPAPTVEASHQAAASTAPILPCMLLSPAVAIRRPRSQQEHRALPIRNLGLGSAPAAALGVRRGENVGRRRLRTASPPPLFLVGRYSAARRGCDGGRTAAASCRV